MKGASKFDLCFQPFGPAGRIAKTAPNVFPMLSQQALRLAVAAHEVFAAVRTSPHLANAAIDAVQLPHKKITALIARVQSCCSM